MLNNVTVFDFETTGFDSVNDRVIEMAAIRIVDGKVVTSFNTLIEIDGELPPKIIEITGITDFMLRGAMNETLAYKLLRNVMQDSLLVAHNAAFDLAFLHHALLRIAGKTFSNPFIDTLTICRERHVYPHKLQNMCERYGIVLEGAHRAFNDVEATWQLLRALNNEKPVDEWVNKLGYLAKFGPPKWAPAHAKVFGTANRYAG